MRSNIFSSSSLRERVSGQVSSCTAAKAFPIESAMLAQAERDLFAINSSRFYRSKENSEALTRPTNLIRADYYV